MGWLRSVIAAVQVPGGVRSYPGTETNDSRAKKGFGRPGVRGVLVRGPSLRPRGREGSMLGGVARSPSDTDEGIRESDDHFTAVEDWSKERACHENRHPCGYPRGPGPVAMGLGGPEGPR